MLREARDAVHGDDDNRVLGFWPPGYFVDPELLPGSLVVGMDAEEEEHERRYGDHHHPRPLGEFRNEKDDGGDRGDARTDAVDRRPTPPMGRTHLSPMHDQPGL